MSGPGSAVVRRPGRGALALLAFIIAGYLWHAGLFIGQINDDAFITFRYSRALSMGRGPYYNPGEHVEGYSNFLLMALLAPVIAVGGEDAALPTAKAIGLLAGSMALVFTYLLGRELTTAKAPRAAAGLLAAGVTAASPGFAQNSTTGLETTLYCALMCAGVWLGLRALDDGRWRGAGAAFAAAMLTRPEGAAVFAVAWCALAAFSVRPFLARLSAAGPLVATRVRALLREPLVFDALVVTGVFAAQTLFRFFAYDGELVPNTYFAKSGGFWKVTPAQYLQKGIVASLLGPAGLLAAVAGLILGRPARGRLLAAACVPAVGLLLPYLTGTDWMPGQRLLMPYLPLAALVVAFGWTGLTRPLARFRPWATSLALVLPLAAVVLTQSVVRRELQERVTQRAAGYNAGHRELAMWLGRESHPGESVALMDIGLIGYLNPDLNILDITGLTDRHIAHSPGTFLKKQYDPGYVLARNPTFIVVVLKAPGDENVPPPPGTPLRAWTVAEERILGSPEFTAHYVRRGQFPAEGDWKARYAWKLGAARLFQHTYPNGYYLLAVFRRDAGGSGPQVS